MSNDFSQNGEEVDVTVFEHNKVGGRVASVEINGQTYDTGGIFFHNTNKLILHFLDVCDLKTKSSKTETVSVYKEHQLLYNAPISFSVSSLYDHLKLLWKFGPVQLLKLQNLNKKNYDFERLYDILQSGKGHFSVKNLLEDWNPEFLKLTTVSFEDYLRNVIGMDEQIVEELVSVFTVLIYGQKPSSIHSYAGDSILKFQDLKSFLVVEGGNVKIAECALKSSGAKLIRKEVKKISKIKQQYKVDDSDELFDVLIIASPLTQDNSHLVFSGFLEEIYIPGSYIPMTATIVQGNLNMTALGIHSDMRSIFYFQVSTNFPIRSIEMLTYAEDDKPVYRIHSKDPITDEFLQTIFVSINEVSRTDWIAVPKTQINPDLGSFQLSEGLYYINRIEMALSSMEVSIVGAKNIANLIKSKYLNHTHVLPKTEL